MSQNLCKLVLAGAIAAVTAVGAPHTAHADATCTALLSSKFSYLQNNGGWYSYSVVVVKDSLNYTTFTSGPHLSLDGSYLSNAGWQTDPIQFSDRYNGNQNFDVNQTEPMYIWIDQTGDLWLYNTKYSYYIVNDVNMSCAGGLVTKYISGLGQVVVMFGPWSTIF
jgi:hypothetical protein